MAVLFQQDNHELQGYYRLTVLRETETYCNQIYR